MTDVASIRAAHQRRIDARNAIRQANRNGLWVDPRPGTKSPHAKLTDAKVRVLRRAKAEGRILKPFIALYGVERTTLYYAASGKTWAHVK